MFRKKYESPELEMISFNLSEVLANSAMDPNDPEIPTTVYDPGVDDDL